MPRSYPMLAFVARHGRTGAWLAALLCATVSLGLAWWGQPLAAGLALVLAPVAWALLRTLAEMIEVVTETLLPR